MNLNEFSNFKLSPSELSSLKGGITCNITATFEDGSQFSDSGLCSGSSVEECNNYATQNCNAFASAGANTCTISCR